MLSAFINGNTLARLGKTGDECSGNSLDLLVIGALSATGLSSTTTGTKSISIAARDNPEKHPQEAPMMRH